MRAICSLGLIAGALLLLPNAASAALEHPFLETFGAANQPSFTKPEGMAVDQSTGDLLVIDAGNSELGEGRISRWNPDGTAANFAALGTNVIGGLSFGPPTAVQIAVDNSGGPTDGDIYVTQEAAGTVNIFAPDGNSIGQLTESSVGPFSSPCGVAVDSSGNVYVGDFSGQIHRFADPPVNGASTELPFARNCTLAAGSGPTDGSLFPVRLQSGEESSQEFLQGEVPKLDSSTGEKAYAVDPGGTVTTTVTVDPASGHLYTASGGEVKEYDASGPAKATQLPSFASGSEVKGIAAARQAATST